MYSPLGNTRKEKIFSYIRYKGECQSQYAMLHYTTVSGYLLRRYIAQIW